MLTRDDVNKVTKLAKQKRLHKLLINVIITGFGLFICTFAMLWAQIIPQNKIAGLGFIISLLMILIPAMILNDREV